MKRILVIEDEAETRDAFLKCLKFEGFKAYGARNGSEGITLAQEVLPHLIVCDILMPDIDGYTVLKTIRKSAQTKTIPFIFLTAKVAMADLRQGMNLGADDYLTKPCTVEQFLVAITTRLKRYEDVVDALESPSENAISLQSTEQSSNDPFDCSFPTVSELKPIFDFIETHYQESPKLNDVARSVGYSPAYLTNLVQKQTGRTIKQWIIARRMKQARILLETTTKSIAEVAALSGYLDAGYFTSQFRKFHGLSPLLWRKKNCAVT